MKSRELKRLVGVVGAVVMLIGIGTIIPMASAQEKIVFWHKTGPEDYMNSLVQAVDRFNQAHPEIKAVIEFPGGGPKYQEKILLAVYAGIAPDVLQIPPLVRYAMERSGEKILAPIDELSANYETELELDDMRPEVIEHNSYYDRLMGVPFFIQLEGAGLVYNKDLFRKAGLNPENPPETIEELVEYAKVLTKDTDGDGTPDEWGYALPFGNRNWMTVIFFSELWRRGAEVYNEDFSEVLVNRPEGVKALQFWVDCYNTYKITDPYAPDLAWMTDLYGYFGSGKVGMSPCSADISGYSFNFDWGVSIYPDIYAGLKVEQFNTHALVTFEQCLHKSAAYEFIRFIMSPEEHPKVMIGVGQLPVRASTLDVPIWKEFVQKTPAMQVFLDLLVDPRYTLRSRPKTPIHNDVRKILVEAIQLAVYGKASSKDALDEAAQKIKETVVKAKQEGLWKEPTWIE